MTQIVQMRAHLTQLAARIYPPSISPGNLDTIHLIAILGLSLVPTGLLVSIMLEILALSLLARNYFVQVIRRDWPLMLSGGVTTLILFSLVTTDTPRAATVPGTPEYVFLYLIFSTSVWCWTMVLLRFCLLCTEFRGKDRPAARKVYTSDQFSSPPSG